MLFLNFIRHIFEYTILYPLRLFYQHGPIWRGTSLPDACAQITNVDASFWVEQPTQCQIMFDRQFMSFSTGVGISIYFTCMLIGFFYLACRCCFIRPVASEIARAFQNNIKSKQKDVLSVNHRSCGYSHNCWNPSVQQT